MVIIYNHFPRPSINKLSIFANSQFCQRAVIGRPPAQQEPRWKTRLLQELDLA
jgi:hypothetical protein